MEDKHTGPRSDIQQKHCEAQLYNAVNQECKKDDFNDDVKDLAEFGIDHTKTWYYVPRCFVCTYLLQIYCEAPLVFTVGSKALERHMFRKAKSSKNILIRLVISKELAREPEDVHHEGLGEGQRGEGAYCHLPQKKL